MGSRTLRSASATKRRTCSFFWAMTNGAPNFIQSILFTTCSDTRSLIELIEIAKALTAVSDEIASDDTSSESIRRRSYTGHERFYRWQHIARQAGARRQRPVGLEL